jgi:hypothetical protein
VPEYFFPLTTLAIAAIVLGIFPMLLNIEIIFHSIVIHHTADLGYFGRMHKGLWITLEGVTMCCRGILVCCGGEDPLTSESTIEASPPPYFKFVSFLFLSVSLTAHQNIYTEHTENMEMIRNDEKV